MPDLTATTTVLTHKLTDCRDTLRERADHLNEWMDELSKVELVNAKDETYGYACPQEVKDFLFELQGDLDDWARTLTAEIGDDAE